MNKAVLICLLIVIGALSLCALPGLTASAQSADPAMMGPLSVESEEYTLGDDAFTAPGLPVPGEVTGVVHYPTNWVGGPLPLILFIHGRHQTCYVGQTARRHWPCDNPNEKPLPNFRGYDYIAKVLASNGYYVVSISANAVAGQEPASRGEDIDSGFDGAEIRARLIKRHLDLWNTYNTEDNARFGTRFIGKIDMQRIGLIGHSRGGESVIKYFKNYPSPLPYNIKAIFVISPTDTAQPDPDHPSEPRKRLKINDVPFAVLLPYCDGDVTNLEGVHFYDDSRYNKSEEMIKDTAPKHTILVIGANHNFFNMIWTALPRCPINKDEPVPIACDDFRDTDSFCGANGSGSGRLLAVDQRSIATAYVCAFMRAYVGGESQFLPLLTNQAPPPPSVGAHKVYVSFHPPDNPFSRLDVNRLVNDTNGSTNTLGGTVTKAALPDYVICGGLSRCLSSDLVSDSEPHVIIQRPMSPSVEPGLKQLRIGWMNKPGALTNNVPPLYRNISGYQALQFRASVSFGPGSPNVASVPVNFKVVLKDGAGATASIRVAEFSSALFYPLGNELSTPQRAILNTVRLPLSAFAGVNLTDIRTVEFKFDQPLQGGLLITDIAFASAAHILLPVFSSDACLKDDSSGSELRFNTATGNYVFCCPGGLTMSGVGKVTVRGNVVSLAQGSNEFDRRLVVTMDRGTGRGTASLQTPAGSLICAITDRNTANNTCSCAPAP